MGRQINFYMDTADEMEFKSAVEERGGVFLALRQQSPGHPKVLASLPDPRTPFATEICIARFEDLPNITTNAFKSGDAWMLDENNDNLIQFHRSRIETNRLLSGRLWIDTQRAIWDPKRERDILTLKDAEFIHFYDSIAKWIRNHYSRVRKSGFWCGPKAESRYSSKDLIVS